MGNWKFFFIPLLIIVILNKLPAMKPDKICISLFLLIIFTTFSWVTSCTHDARITDLPIICVDDVVQIFSINCAISNCHDGNGESNLNLSIFQNIRDGVVPGKPNSSSLYKAIISTSGENVMPPKQPLSLENRTIIRVWIEQGAQSIPCPEPKATGEGVVSR